MPTVAVSELIERAKIAADMENSNFVSSSGWLYFVNSEYKNLYTRVARMGWPLKTTNIIVTSTGAYSYSIAEPAAIISVRRVGTDGSLTRVPIKSEISLKHNTPLTGMPREVIISKGAADTIVLKFNPNPAIGTVFHVNTVAVPTQLISGIGAGTTISLPLGWEERIVLGMARKALGKEETTNSVIERDIIEMDNVIENSAYSFLLAESGTVTDMNEISQTDWFWI